MNTLRLRARGTVLCAHYQAHANGTRRFIGRRLDRTIGHDEKNPENGQMMKTGGWPSTGEAEEVPYCAEYLFAVRDGDVWAADEETAAICKVTFDPHFGGELEEHSTAPSEHQEIADYAADKQTKTA